VNVAASVISASIIIGFMGAESKWLNLVVMVPILLLFGEITPKTLAIRKNVTFATHQSRFVDLFALAITPLRRAVRLISDQFITLIVGSERSRANLITEDMVRSLAREGVGEGALDNKEAQYINQIFDFGGKAVGDVMTPRSQIFLLSAALSLDEMGAGLHRTRHTKAPIFEGDEDAVVGILFARDLLGVDLANATPADLRKLLRKPYFVPESRTVVDLFHILRKRKFSLALVGDEYGGVTGLVTMEDLVECIFGDIPSESDLLKQQMVDHEVLGEDQYRIEGSMNITQFNQLVGTALVDDEAETIGGLLLNRFGEVPPEGARIVLESFEFVVASIANHRIDAVVVKPKSSADKPPGGTDPSSAPKSSAAVKGPGADSAPEAAEE
ncbi:MAG: hemolysin family protein, partial [Desulfobacterales bacterium]|nr:hemolysin family protein [Desulfobacterales bacterium]